MIRMGRDGVISSENVLNLLVVEFLISGVFRSARVHGSALTGCICVGAFLRGTSSVDRAVGAKSVIVRQ